MYIEQQKKLFEEGNHICVRHGEGWSTELRDEGSPDWDWSYAETHYHWIHKKHAHILDAFLDGCEIYVIGQQGYGLITDFIESYEEDWDYYTIPKSLENCYCDANELHYNELVKSGKQTHLETSVHLVYAMYAGFPNSAFVYTIRSITNEKQIEYNTQLQNWIYCPKETEDVESTHRECENVSDVGNTISSNDNSAVHTSSTELEVHTCGDTKPKETTNKEQISLNLVDAIKPINNFEEYGLKPITSTNFEGAILAQVEGKYIGWIKVSKDAAIQACHWRKDGTMEYGYAFHFNLTPIAPEPVYPVLKKDKYGGVMKVMSDTEYTVLLNKDLSVIGNVNDNLTCFSVDDLTDIEYDAERGLYHGQPIWLFEGRSLPGVYLYNVTTDSLCDPKEVVTCNRLSRLDKIEPIPLKALKHMPFVWEQYLEFIKDK